MMRTIVRWALMPLAVMLAAGCGDRGDKAGPETAGVEKAEPASRTLAATRAQSAALLRAHRLPGADTRSDIAAAVDRAGADGAQMRTMADSLVTFTRDGQAIVATAPDGARARLTGEEALVSNGVLQPVDGLLVRPGAPAG